MHHYTLKSAHTITDKPSQVPAFQEWCPQNVEKHPFLLDGMLSMAAFHLAHLRTDEASIWVPAAIRHQTSALMGFRNTLKNDVTEENCHALFAQSLFLSTTSLAATKYMSNGELGSSFSLDDILEPFMHIRGAGDVCLTAYWWIKNGPLSEMLPGNFLRVEGELAGPIDTRIKDLKNMILQKYSGTPLEIHLMGATEALRFVFKETAFAPQARNNPRYIWKWANLVNQSYINLLRTHEPGALILFAHFALLSATYEREWYFHGWAGRAIKAVSDALPEDWKEWIHWTELQLAAGLVDFKEPAYRPARTTEVSITPEMIGAQQQVCSESSPVQMMAHVSSR
jgi:hypothetical protein